MSGAGLIELLAARLARRVPREAAPELRQVLQSRMMRPEDVSDVTRRDISTWGPRGVAGDEVLDRPIQVTPTSVDDLLANNPQFLEDPERAAEFAARSTPLPPVMMRGGKLIDGRHRLEAARIRGNDTIDAVDLDQFERPSAPSLRSALSEVNAARTGPDAGPPQTGRLPRRVVDVYTRNGQTHPTIVNPSEADIMRLTRAGEDRGVRYIRDGDNIYVGNSYDVTHQDLIETHGLPDRGSLDGGEIVRRADGTLELQNNDGAMPLPRGWLNPTRTAPDGGPVQAGRAPIGRGRSKTVYDDPADPARVIVEMPPDPVTEAFLQFSRDAHARRLPFARHLPNPDAVESAGNVVRYRTERLAPNDTRARVGRESGEFFITGVDDAEQSGSIIAAMNALDDHLRRTLPPNTPRHFYDLGPQNFMRRADGTLVINDPVESTGFAPRTGPNAGSDRNALQRALRDRMERE